MLAAKRTLIRYAEHFFVVHDPYARAASTGDVIKTRSDFAMAASPYMLTGGGRSFRTSQ
jgi:hypothetical protein